ncbi:M3 family metallopeptidase [Bdellovibrionota bacterium FG-1]
MALLEEINHQYLVVHTTKEDAFWGYKMGLKAYVPGSFEKAEVALREWINDDRQLLRLRQELGRDDLSPEERLGLEGWKRFFEVNLIEKSDACLLANKITEMEGDLERRRRAMKIGYVHPQTGTLVESDSMGLALLMRTQDDEGIRKAARDGLKAIEIMVLENGFMDLIRQRNRLGRMLGYEDYYDFKVSRNEGFSKVKLFELLDELERDTRTACQTAVTRLKNEKGPAAGDAWNFGFLCAGSVTQKLDPFFQFQTALGRWGRSFMNLGIRYRGSSLTLDLLSRKGKYENGFMHGPIPAFTEGGKWSPAAINFTSLGTPGQVGSGYSELHTLFHEGGHAAHFSNVIMPAPCFSQEFAPTSVAFAETQSMFCDSLVGDPDWRVRYAQDSHGKSIPHGLIREGIEITQKYCANRIRQMLTVCYVEKALYEMPDSQLTVENILKTVREIEREFSFLNEGPRPTLSVPHLLSGESSAYYHGYVLAEMAVHHTRAFFLNRDGFLLDNPRIGSDLAQHYWRPGNSRTFLELIEDLTGRPFSAEAIVTEINRELPEAMDRAEAAIRREKQIPCPQSPVELEARIALVHGDEVIASNHQGESFEELDRRFAAWIERGVVLNSSV